MVGHGTYTDVNIRVGQDHPSFDSCIGVQLHRDFVPPIVKAQRDEMDSILKFCLEFVEGCFVDVIRHCCDQFIARREIHEP